MDDKGRQLWDEYSDTLSKYIRKKVSHPYDAEDILQDVFIKIYKNINKLNGLTNLNSWIYRLTKNTIIDYYRKKKDTPVGAELFEKTVAEENREENLNDEISKCLGAMIDELPRTQKEAIDQHDIKGMKHKEISEKCHISISSSKMRVHRGKEKLKDTLLNCCEFKVDAFGNILDYKLKKDNCTQCECSRSEFKQD